MLDLLQQEVSKDWYVSPFLKVKVLICLVLMIFCTLVLNLQLEVVNDE